MKSSTPLLLAGAATAAALLFFSGCATAPAPVARSTPASESTLFYGEFSTQGASDKVAARYPYFSMANTQVSAGQMLMDKVCRDFFSSLGGVANADGSKTIALNQWTKLKLGAPGQKNDAPLAFSVGLAQEVVLHETIGAKYAIEITLTFNLLVLDFSQMEVVSAIPFQIRLRDVSDVSFTDAKIASRVREMLVAGADGQSRFTKALRLCIADVRGWGKNKARLQVTSVSLGDGLLSYLPDTVKANMDSYKETLGQSASAVLGSESKVAMLPFSKDRQNTRMALSFSNSSEGPTQLDFKIPPPSFTLDIQLEGIDKTMKKSDSARTIWSYVAKGKAVLAEPLSQKVFYSGESAFEVTKFDSSAKTQTDEFPTVSNAFSGLFKKMSEDMERNKTARANILDKCRL